MRERAREKKVSLIKVFSLSYFSFIFTKCFVFRFVSQIIIVLETTFRVFSPTRGEKSSVKQKNKNESFPQFFETTKKKVQQIMKTENKRLKASLCDKVFSNMILCRTDNSLCLFEEREHFKNKWCFMKQKLIGIRIMWRLSHSIVR